MFQDGHGIMASAWVPIKDNTLVSGSNDAGLTVKNKSEEARKLTQQLASKFHLLPHSCRGVEVYTGVDVEVHQSTEDGRLCKCVCTSNGGPRS